jgi:hypothetical protein
VRSAFLPWLSQNWFALLQSAGIIGSLLFTGITLRDDVRSRRVGNLIAITGQHREIWGYLYSRPELTRVLDATTDLKRVPISEEEELFVTLLILHLNSSYQAMKSGMLVKPEGLHRDIRTFFSLPIPRLVWNKAKAWDFSCFEGSNGDS